MFSARSTVSIARTTPAQKLRGAHRRTRSLGFGTSGGTAAWADRGHGIGATVFDMGRGPGTVKQGEARPGGAALDTRSPPAYIWEDFPVIPDDMRLRPRAGGARGRFCRGRLPWPMRC